MLERARLANDGPSQQARVASDVKRESACGPSRHFACAQKSRRFQVKAAIKWHAGSLSSVENDPTATRECP
jgi:hypothetical protein